MASIMQPRLESSSSTAAMQGESLTSPLTMSPASTNLEIDASLPASVSADIGLQFYDQYKRDLNEYRSIFNKHMKNKPVKHDRVFVLMWTWADGIDDLGVKEEVDRLEDVFKNTYSFQVERKELNTLEKASHQLNSFLSSFMALHDESNTLLIFYYAGHGLYEDNTVVFTGTTAGQTVEEKERNNVAWSSSEHNIKARSADVLVIFDCCSAGGFGGYATGRASRQTPFQCIAACGSFERTPKPGPTSFTSALIWALKGLRSHHPFTSRNLLDKIKEHEQLPKTQHPTLLRRDEYNDALVWIAPLKLAKNESVTTRSERRNPSHEYLDLRLNFYRRVRKNDAEMVAKCLSKLIHEDRAFQAKHIVLLDKTSAHSKAIVNFTSGINKKRKRSTSSLSQSPTALGPDLPSVPYTNGFPDSAIEVDQIGLPPHKRQRLMDPYVETLQPQTAFYHFRMALHCSLQSVRSQIGRFADRIRPSVRETDDSLSDID
ncbi:hypothetical protein K458DRAFT_397715 [Lentithecium fluviatile CBS 122367]|uniref:Peptidase C14 caspase domain-containing protein n=1 Tax=Lentithecium fluviatile CBS 122367 TaxID=1168545 RepID=A0A6G1IC28_9PLEO|nr:hypothetical protein K458DRAFT_397715 [Lentithecium fluviatile CBS 122367]